MTKRARKIVAGFTGFGVMWSFIVLMARHSYSHSHLGSSIYHFSYWHIYGVFSMWAGIVVGSFAAVVGLVIFFVWWIDKGPDKSKREIKKDVVRQAMSR